jgi:quercetin dioxygenase-like cupin family protein
MGFMFAGMIVHQAGAVDTTKVQSPSRRGIIRTVSRAQRAVATVRIDNERVRVTEWRFAPGTSTGWHRHELAYVVVPLTTGRLTATGQAGHTVNELVTGQPYFGPAGVEHDVHNANPFEVAFIEVELKR